MQKGFRIKLNDPKYKEAKRLALHDFAKTKQPIFNIEVVKHYRHQSNSVDYWLDFEHFFNGKKTVKFKIAK